MNKFSVVFCAVLFLLSMQKKDGGDKENSSNLIDSEKNLEAGVNETSSEVSTETVKGSNPSKKDDEKETPEKKKSGEKVDDKEKTKKSATTEKSWKEVAEEIRKNEKATNEVLKKIQEKANKGDDVKGYREAVNELVNLIVKIEIQVNSIFKLLKSFDEDVEAKKRSGEKIDDALLEDSKKAKEEEVYMGKVRENLKKWKLTFSDHFFALCSQNASQDKKVEVFAAEKEGSSNLVFYGCVAVVVCISFVLGYFVGGRKN